MLDGAALAGHIPRPPRSPGAGDPPRMPQTSTAPQDMHVARPDARAGEPGARKRIARSIRIDVKALSELERRRLADRLYVLYADVVCGLSRVEFDAEVFGAADTRLAVYYGADGELAGFVYRRFDRLEHDGLSQAVVGAGVYFRLDYRGGAASARFGLGEALRFKLRHPRTPLAYLTRSASPAVYRLLASTMPRAYPHPQRPTPAAIGRWVHLAHARCGYVSVADHPWVVQSIAVPIQPERLRRLADDPLVRHYLQVNPSFAEGSALLVWIPLDLGNVLGGLWRLALRSVRGR